MKRQEGIALLGSAVAVLAALVLFWQAGQLWTERGQLLTLAAEQQLLVAQSASFAREHSDYEAYAARQQQRLQTLERSVQAGQSPNKLLQRLQALAVAQKIHLLSVELPAGAKAQGKAEPQAVRLRAEGDFFQLLRWLRQVERSGIHLNKMHLQAGEKQLPKIQIELAIELNKANL